MKTRRTDTENMQHRKTRSDRVFFGCICILLTAFVLYRIIHCYWDNDFYHIATSGRWIAEHGIMRENPFFVEEGYKTVIQQWLYAVLLYASYRCGGFYGVLLFTILQAVLFGVSGYHYLKTREIDRRFSVIGAILMVLSVTEPNCRPEIISLLLFTVQLIVLEDYFRKRKKGILYVLPFLVLLEINLHAAYAIFHFILLLPYLVPVHRLPMCRELCEWCGIRRDKPGYRDFILPVLLMVVALLINPYGTQAVLILLHSGNIRLLGIREIQQTTLLSPGAVLLFFEILFAAVAVCRRKLREATALLGIGCTLMGLIAIKNLLFMSLVLLVLAGDCLERIDGSAFWDFLAKGKQTYAFAALAAVLLLCAGLLSYGTILRVETDGRGFSNGLLPKTKDTEQYPKAAITYLLTHEAHPEDLRVMTTFNNGSAFLWNGIGHVYLEPKTEPYLRAVNGKRDVVTEYVQILSCADSEQIAHFLDKYDFDYIVCSAYMQGLQVYLEQTEGYECVLVSETMIDTYEEETGYSQPAYRLYRKKE